MQCGKRENQCSVSLNVAALRTELSFKLVEEMRKFHGATPLLHYPHRPHQPCSSINTKTPLSLCLRFVEIPRGNVLGDGGVR